MLSTFVDLVRAPVPRLRGVAHLAPDAEASARSAWRSSSCRWAWCSARCSLGFALMFCRALAGRPGGTGRRATACSSGRKPRTEQAVTAGAAHRLPRRSCSPACRWRSPWSVAVAPLRDGLGHVPDFVVIHRMYGGIDSFPLLAVPFFILAGNLMNSAGITNRIYNFALALVGWLKGGPRPRQRRRLDDLRRHVGHRHRRRRGPGHDRDQGDEGPRLLDRILGRRHRRLGHGRADHPAVAALRHLRHDGRASRSGSCSSPASSRASSWACS